MPPLDERWQRTPPAWPGAGVKGLAGAMSQYMLADARLIALKPKTLSMRDAASLPLASITAWEAIERTAVSARDHIPIQGATGGVSHLAVQLAKARGARVVASVRKPSAVALARSLGADEATDAQGEPLAAAIKSLTDGKGFNVVFNTLGGGSLVQTFAPAAANGRFAAIAARSTHDLSPLHAKGLSLHVIFMLLPIRNNSGRERHGKILREIANLVDGGKLRTLVDARQFSLADAAQAHQYLEDGQSSGKVVVEVD